MSKIEIVNNIDHANLHVIPEFAAQFDNLSWIYPTFIQEFRQVVREYPVLLHQSQAGELTPVVLCGLNENENVFVKDGTWQASHIPLSAQRLPFSIGFQQTNTETIPVVTLDISSPQVNAEKGQPLFLPHGGNTPYLDQITNVLQHLHIGSQSNPSFIDTLNKFELIENVTFDITTSKGNKKLVGFSTIREERLAELNGEQLSTLHTKGYLEPIFLMLTSLQNMSGISSRSQF